MIWWKGVKYSINFYSDHQPWCIPRSMGRGQLPKFYCTGEWMRVWPPPKNSWLLSVMETQNDNYLQSYIILNMHTWSWKSIILNSWLTLYSTDRGRILANRNNYVILCISDIFFQTDRPCDCSPGKYCSWDNWVGITWILFCAY